MLRCFRRSEATKVPASPQASDRYCSPCSTEVCLRFRGGLQNPPRLHIIQKRNNAALNDLSSNWGKPCALVHAREARNNIKTLHILNMQRFLILNKVIQL
jgi:hypothetical protein